MPRPPFTRFPKDKPLPRSQRGELTKAFNNRNGQAGGGTSVTNIVERATLGGSGGSAGSGGGGGGTTVAAALAGDVTGSTSANTITKIQGNPIAPQAIQNGQTYVLIGGSLVPSALGGDVAGNLAMNSVQAIQGVPVESVGPLDQQELVYDASAGAYAPGVNPGAILSLWAKTS
ncbi:MAG TPA: hypothetical protein VFW40_06230 [Capsulimonadaceae bacterium]|nr:hypothetical protein [Capsulimonadaceae bacterium]